MKNFVRIKRLLCLLVLLPAGLFVNVPGAVAQTGGYNPLNVHVLLPGTTRVIDIEQMRLFPLGTPQFFVFVIGKGTLGISVKKDDVAGDTIFMLGAAVSGAGTEAIYRVGQSNGMIDQIVEIGSRAQPYGFVWLYCGVAASTHLPYYRSQLRLSLAQ